MDLAKVQIDFRSQGERAIAEAEKSNRSKANIEFVKGTSLVVDNLISDFVEAVVKESKKNGND